MSKTQEFLTHIFNPMMPVSFDINEYYTLVITCIVSMATAIVLKRKYRIFLLSEAISIIVFNLAYTSFFEFILAIPPIDLYDTIDRNGRELFDLLLEVIVYPLTIFIFIHFYLAWKMSKITFLFFGVIALVFFEWISEHYFAMFQYKHFWNLFYSAIFYTFTLIVNVYLTNWIHQKRTKERVRSVISQENDI